MVWMGVCFNGKRLGRLSQSEHRALRITKRGHARRSYRSGGRPDYGSQPSHPWCSETPIFACRTRIFHAGMLTLAIRGRCWDSVSRRGGSLGGEVVEVVASGVRALESSKSAPKRVPGPPRTGRDPSESRRSNSPTDLLPRCRRTLAFAGLRAGRPPHKVRSARDRTVARTVVLYSLNHA